MPLTLVTVREELVDLVTRCALSLDVDDGELSLSVWTISDPNSVDATVAGVTTKGVDKLCRTYFDVVGPMGTHHSIASIRVDIHDRGGKRRRSPARHWLAFPCWRRFKEYPGSI